MKDNQNKFLVKTYITKPSASHSKWIAKKEECLTGFLNKYLLHCTPYFYLSVHKVVRTFNLKHKCQICNEIECILL